MLQSFEKFISLKVTDTNSQGGDALSAVEEKSLERMEALLRHAASGIHILFDNDAIAKVLARVKDDKDFFDFDKMKRVQDCMTALVAKDSYYEKMAYLRELDQESYEMLIRTYFHIVENTIRASHEMIH